MIWQDVLFGVGGVAFFLLLLPAVRDPQKPPLSTTLGTGGWLLAFAGAYGTLGLTLAATTTLASAAVWFTLAWQRWRQT